MEHAHLQDKVMEAVKLALEPGLQGLHSYQIETESDGFHDAPAIIVKCQSDESPLTKANVLRISFMHEDQQLQIPTLYLPNVLRGNKVLFKLLKSILAICRAANYDLFIVDMVPSFHRKMVSIGAANVDDDTVAILPETRLE